MLGLKGLKGIDNIKKAMDQRQEEREEVLSEGAGIAEAASAGEDAEEVRPDLERRVAERLAQERRAAEERREGLGRFLSPRPPKGPEAAPPAPSVAPAPGAISSQRPLEAPQSHPIIDRYYLVHGTPPPRHREVLEAMRAALGGEAEGELDLQADVLDKIGIKRASAIRIVRHLVEHGYLEYEPRYHCVWARVLK